MVCYSKPWKFAGFLPKLNVTNDSIPAMRPIAFAQIDKITEIVSGDRISAVKFLSGDEDYLQDHFPHFPVMPGVLMLEAMLQASSWLVRYTTGFKYSVVELCEAKNIKFQNLVTPNNQLIVNAKIMKQEELIFTLKTECLINDETAVNGRLVVETHNYGERNPSNSVVDEKIAFEKRLDFDSIMHLSR